MNLVSYLKTIYGYDASIFLRDVRIGGKNKSAIKEEFCRAKKKGDIECDGGGVYFIHSNKEFGSGIVFEDVVKRKFIYSNNAPIGTGLEDLFIEGYYSGMTFLNMIGISEQSPAIEEITTNKTSSKKKNI